MTTPEQLDAIFAPMRADEHVGVPHGAKAGWLRDFDPRTAGGLEKRNREWGIGPWWSEPDRLEWRSHGLPCLVVRNPMGSLCGYVGLPPEHPLHGKGYEDDGVPYVHGGATYAAACAHRVCHVPAPGESDNVWWFGFDCAHAGDLTPSLRKHASDHEGWSWTPRPLHSTGIATAPDEEMVDFRREVYRAIPYVVAETERFAEALRGAA